MLNRLFTFFTNRRASARAAAEQRDFQALEELAPVKGTVPPPDLTARAVRQPYRPRRRAFGHLPGSRTQP
ncbi:MAG: hypothetical protein V9G98_19930 [Candidatus Competibacter sp.]